jgi:hypothetical protein
MTQRTYRTAQGKVVDLGALQLKNEGTRAVGNVPVNARGDLIDSQNRPIDSRNQQVAKQYRKQVTNVQDDVVVSGKTKKTPQNQMIKPATETQSVETVVAPAEQENSGGLAAAIARARQVKQEPVETAKQQSRSQAGVKKL